MCIKKLAPLKFKISRWTLQHLAEVVLNFSWVQEISKFFYYCKHAVLNLSGNLEIECIYLITFVCLQQPLFISLYALYAMEI